MVICLERCADLRMAQLMPLPLTVSCFSKIDIGFTFLVPAHPGSPGKRAVKRVCVCGSVGSRCYSGCIEGLQVEERWYRWWSQKHHTIVPVWRRLAVSLRTTQLCSAATTCSFSSCQYSWMSLIIVSGVFFRFSNWSDIKCMEMFNVSAFTE